MKTAKELYNITQNSVPRIVNDILCGVKEHIIKRCEEEANRGKGHYTIYLKRGLSVAKKLLLEECIKLIKEFEDNGYKVYIEDIGNSYYIEFIIIVSWDEKYIKNNKNHILYTTDNGIIERS